MLSPVSRRAPAVVLSLEEGARLQSWARTRSQAQRLVQQVILIALEGVKNKEIAARLRVSRPTVRVSRQRFLASARGQAGEGRSSSWPDPTDHEFPKSSSSWRLRLME